MPSPKGPTTTPQHFPETTPHLPSADYSYTVELVGTLQNQLGRLTEAVESLKIQSRDQATELKTIGKDIHGAKVGIRIIIGVCALAGTIIGFLISRVADILQARVLG